MRLPLPRFGFSLHFREIFIMFLLCQEVFFFSIHFNFFQVEQIRIYIANE